MQIVRLSAVETFGAPVDVLEQVNTPERALTHMRQYSATEIEVPSDLMDITPYYLLEEHPLRYFLSRRNAEGPAVVERVPLHDGSPEHAATLPATTLVVPEDVTAFTLMASGPRFPGKLCVHEFIFDADSIEQ